MHFVPTGIAGLDSVLRGGVPRGSLYLVDGQPGVGKTTLALQFLIAGRDAKERGLYVTLSETRREVEDIAESHGWSLEKIALLELSSMEARLQSEASQTILHPAELELEETTKPILEEVERTKPDRVVIDSVSEIRLLAREPLRYRRQILALKQFFIGRSCTVLLLDDMSSEDDENLLASVAHGVISLEKKTPIFGPLRRRLQVIKMRGVGFSEGYHDVRLRKGGLTVFPRLVATEHKRAFRAAVVSSGIPELDTLVGGGLDQGTANLVQGPPGAGKSSLAQRYCWAAAERGELVAIYNFDERPATALARTEALGMPLQKHLETGRIQMKQVDPAEMSPGEFATDVQRQVERNGVKLVLIDSLNGYFYAMPEQNALMLHLHELFTYLGQQGVTSIFTLAQQGLVTSAESPLDVSYLADTVFLLRLFESHGNVRKALSVIKRRGGEHEHAIRELTLQRGGITLGPPLAELQGVLTGQPVSDSRPAK